MEGQLGVIVETQILTREAKSTQFFIIKIPFWFQDSKIHMEIFEKIQEYRGKVLTCELVDNLCLTKIGKRDQGYDYICLEIERFYFEEIYENFFLKLNCPHENIVEIQDRDFQELRQSVPRGVQEYISRHQLLKKGTDIQTDRSNFSQLIGFYREAFKLGVDCMLFGHFGDAHLHFNFLPRKDEIEVCDQFLNNLYREILNFPSSPFAEHGIGIIKLKYIEPYLLKEHRLMFEFLKNKFDPKDKFFPYGFLRWRHKND